MSIVATAEIYVIVCLVTLKVYVGSAMRGYARLKDHWAALARGSHENTYLQRAWNKHGADNFSSRIAETCSLEDRWVREQWWIDHLHACDRRFGFNVMHSVQQLLPSKAMSKRLKRYWKKRWEDPEYKKLRTEELTNLVKKPGVRAKMQTTKRAHWQDPAYRELQVRKHQEYAAKNRDKLSAQAKSAWDNPEYRAKQMAERKARFADPAFRAKLSEAAKNRPVRAKWYHAQQHS